MKSALQNALLVVVSIVVSFVLFEVGVKVYVGRSLEGSYWIYSSDKTIKFDPVAGYRLTRDITLEARISHGEIEYVGALRGNNRGFPSRNFVPGRQDQRRRFAVFGDSFTHGEFFVRNWPAYAEDLTANDARPVEFLNFALSGGGLANWWSVIKNALPSYELDGVIFADYVDDLYRPFTIAHMNDRQFSLGRLPFWDAARYPKTLGTAMPYMQVVKQEHYIFDDAGFWRALSGEWRPNEWFIEQQYRAITAKRVYSNTPAPNPENEMVRQAMIKDIAAWIAERHLPAFVIYLPSRDDLLAQQDDSLYRIEAQRFAQAIGATFYDSSSLYAGMSEVDIRAHFLPYDGHWNLAGSDLLATYVLRLIQAN